MPKCTWREKPGSPESCNLLADADGINCPRHAFLAKLAAEKKDQKEGEKARAIGRKPVANTRIGLLQTGLMFVGTGTCRECKAPVEWWKTLKLNNAPYNPMPEENSPAVSHFATCPNAASFRKSA